MVRAGDVIRVEKIPVENGSAFKADKVLLTSDGTSTKVGTPYLAKASVDLKILSAGLNEKVITFKMKAKKRYKRSKNWRQPYTEVEVTKIVVAP